jgi:hypothetical protein
MKETIDQGCIFCLEAKTDMLNRFRRIQLKDRLSLAWRVTRRILREKKRKKIGEVVTGYPVQ